MSKLTVRTRTEHLIDVGDFDKLVIDTYGKSYSFQQQDDCKERHLVRVTVPEEASDYDRDTVPEVINGREMGVSFKAWLARDPKEWNGKPEDIRFIDMFWERNFYPDVQMILNDLHEKGLIDAGDYAIDIDW